MADNDFAIVIGISRYPQLRDLQGPKQDALEFRDWLRSSAKVPAKNIKTILSKDLPKPGDRPVLWEIDKAFENLFQKAKGTEARRLYIYCAGHGCSAEADHLAFLMADASLDTLNRAMNVPSYHRGLGKRPLFREQLMFYDCCRNYDRRVVGRDPDWSNEDPAAGAAEVQQFVLYAAAFTQYANEKVIEYSERRGLFTKALLEGLRGHAPAWRDGNWVVTTRTLVPYVENRLRELAMNFNLVQKPSVGPGLAQELIIAEVEPTFSEVTVQGPEDGSEIVVRDDRLTEVRRDRIQGGTVRIPLAPGLYQFAVSGNGRGCLYDVLPGRPQVVRL